MLWTVVAETSLMRTGTRIEAALAPAFQVAVHQDAAPQVDGPVIYLGGVRPPALQDAEARYDHHGVRVGFETGVGWVECFGVDNPAGLLETLSQAADELHEVGALKLRKVAKDPSRWRGVHLMGRFLDPALRVPHSTLQVQLHRFTPERVLWERQYTLGIAVLLQTGFDLLVAGAP